MLKVISVLVVLFIIYIMFFKKTSIKTEKKQGKKKISGDTMLECSECATFVSENEAIIKDGKFYCSKECALL